MEQDIEHHSLLRLVVDNNSCTFTNQNFVNHNHYHHHRYKHHHHHHHYHEAKMPYNEISNYALSLTEWEKSCIDNMNISTMITKVIMIDITMRMTIIIITKIIKSINTMIVNTIQRILRELVVNFCSNGWWSREANWSNDYGNWDHWECDEKENLHSFTLAIMRILIP